MSVLNPIFPSPTMEQGPLFRCHDCKNCKPKDQFSLRKRDDKHGARGEPSSRCLPCAAKERARHETKKRKRAEEGLDASGDPAEAGRPISIEQFTALLREQVLTGKIYYSARVSTQGLAGEADEMRAGIVRHVWEATGFRFTYGPILLEGIMTNPPTIQLDTIQNTSGRMALSSERTNAAKRQPVAIIAKRGSRWTSKAETGAECLASLAMERSI